MSPGLVTAFYLAAAILFILALGGLSNQEKAKRAIWYGIVGMALAVVATIFGGSGALLAAGADGDHRRRGRRLRGGRVQMTQMPELVAGFHSLVGLAAVFIGLNADVEAARVAARARRRLDRAAVRLRRDAGAQDPGRALDHAGRDLPRHPDRRHHLHRLDRRLRQARRPHLLEAADAAEPARDQHRRRAALPAARHPLLQRRRHLDDGARRADRRLHRLAPDHGDRRRRHAGRDLDAEQLLGLGRGGDRLHPLERPAHRHRRAGRLLGCDPHLHHVPGDEPQLRLA